MFSTTTADARSFTRSVMTDHRTPLSERWGGWFVTGRFELPIRASIDQGEHTGRRCKLGLRVDTERNIYVTGDVIEIGSGEIALD